MPKNPFIETTFKYCITHGRMTLVEFGEITGKPVHLHMEFLDDVSWCAGPFAETPPPDIDEDYWRAVFENEETR